MKELLLEPIEFQKQIDEFNSGKDSIAELKYSVEADGIKLDSIKRYLECIELMNETLTLFVQMQNQDVESLKRIKAKWMNVDSDIATKTLWEIIK